MNLKFLCLLFYLFFSKCYAQNLVKNPDFEIYDTCPDKFATNFRKTIIPFWKSPSMGTPDYYNSCSEGSADIPKNWSGDCSAISGNAYTGIYLWKRGGFREYLKGELSQPLDSGKIYSIGFYISLALNSEYLIENIGLVLTRDSLSKAKHNSVFFSSLEYKVQDNFSTKRRPANTANYDYYIDPKMGNYLEARSSISLSETKEWEYVEWMYTADGGEQYITIGNFVQQRNCKVAKTEFRLFDEPMLNGSAYVLIDNVTVKLVNQKEEAPKPQAGPFVLSDINFESNSHYLLPHGYVILDSLINTFKYEASEYRLKIVGHTDDIGTLEYNKTLGYRRAKSIGDYLITFDFNKDRVLIESSGESNPIKSNGTSVGRERNRRVEIDIIHITTVNNKF